jgi:uncharacterized membrane protein YeaQ/YmgE (transglycosylase-associated protein family)
VKKLTLAIIFTLVVSCSSIGGFIDSITKVSRPVQVDSSQKGKVVSTLFAVTHLGTIGGFIVALLAGVFSATIPSKRLAGVAFIAALIGSTCLLCVFILPYLDYIVWGVIAALSIGWGYQLYKRHHEGVKHKEAKEVIKDLSMHFESTEGREKLTEKARVELAIHEGGL